MGKSSAKAKTVKILNPTVPNELHTGNKQSKIPQNDHRLLSHPVEPTDCRNWLDLSWLHP